MLAVIFGLVLLALKFFQIGPVAAWPWWWVLAPFAVAALWWAVSDKLGVPQRRAVRAMELRRRQRREKHMKDLRAPTTRSAKL